MSINIPKGSDLVVQGGGAFNPAQIPGNILWLRADLGVTVDGSDRVSLWEDQSVSGHDISNSDTDEQPIQITGVAAVNNQAVIDFDGVDDKLWNSSSLDLGTGGKTWFIVLKADTIGALYILQDGSYGTSAGAYGFTPVVQISGAGAFSSWVSVIGTTNYHYLTFTSPNPMNINSTELRLDGSDETRSVTNNLAIDVVAGRFAVGDRWQGSSWIGLEFDGQIAEIIAYDSELDGTDTATVEAYLADRYGL